MSKSKPVLEMKNVCKTYELAKGKIVVNALSNVNIKIKKGDFLSITGQSGSGKSTLLHMMGVLDKPTKGSIYLDGINVSKLEDNQLAEIRRTKIGFVFQTFNLIPRLSSLENVMMPMWFAGVEPEKRIERAKELLKKVGLAKRMNSRPNELSGGERQRVAIARALANKPEIILADEPTGNLDSKTGKIILKILKKLNKEGNTLIIVTHEQNIAKQAQKQIKLLDGEIK